LLGLDGKNNIGATVVSASATIGSGLSGTGKGVKLAVPASVFAGKPAAIQVFGQRANSEPFYLVGQKPIPTDFLWKDLAPNAPVNLYFAGMPTGLEPTTDDFGVGGTDTVYGVKNQVFNFGLGDNAIQIAHTPESFDSMTDAVMYRFKTGATTKVTVSVNPADEDQLENVLRRIGYKYYGNREANYGAPLDSVPSAMFFDMNIPYITSSAQNRIFLFGVTSETLDEAAIEAALKKKDPFNITFNFQKTPFIHASRQNWIGRE
jgi:hypothetical protein